LLYFNGINPSVHQPNEGSGVHVQCGAFSEAMQQLWPDAFLTSNSNSYNSPAIKNQIIQVKVHLFHNEPVLLIKNHADSYYWYYFITYSMHWPASFKPKVKLITCLQESVNGAFYMATWMEIASSSAVTVQLSQAMLQTSVATSEVILQG